MTVDTADVEADAVVKITDIALEQILELRQREDEAGTLDLPAGGSEGGLVLRNPNRPNPLEGIDVDLSGSPAEKVTQLLEQSINPALASHGGFALLERVEDDKAYVTMGGGCQGCAVSALTLREGIEAAILEAVPEITEVVDTTDHEAGENPFYT